MRKKVINSMPAAARNYQLESIGRKCGMEQVFP